MADTAPPLPPRGPVRPARLALSELEVLQLGHAALKRELLETKVKLCARDAELVTLRILARYGVPAEELERWHYDPVAGALVLSGGP